MENKETEKAITPEEYFTQLKSIKDTFLGLSLDVVDLHQKTKTKELHDVLILLTAANKSLNEII